MARARNIKPGFFTNELLGTYDPIISLLFAGLWCLADKEGILEDRPLRIKAELFPYRDNLDVNGYLTVLERDGFVVRYVIDGTAYIQIRNFEKHQHPHHTEKPRGYPKPQGIEGKQPLTPLSNGDTPSDSLIPDSLIQCKPPLTPPDGGEVVSKAKPSLFDAKAEMLAQGVDDLVADDFLNLRKRKRAAVTATALRGLVKEADKAGMTLNDALAMCCVKGWQGFDAAWVAVSARASPRQTINDQRAEVIEVLTGKKRDERREIDITGQVERVAIAVG